MMQYLPWDYDIPQWLRVDPLHLPIKLPTNASEAYKPDRMSITRVVKRMIDRGLSVDDVCEMTYWKRDTIIHIYWRIKKPREQRGRRKK